MTSGGHPDRRSLGPRIGVVPLVIIALAAVILLAVGWWCARPAKLLEVDRSTLALRDGALYRVGDTTPFTGLMVERYPDGTLKSRASISRGVLDGLTEGWHTNGQLQVREYFHRGLSDGTRVKWYANGAVESEAQIAAGKLEGTFRRWRPDGSLAEKVQLRDNLPDGISMAYYPSGFLKRRVQLEAGKVVAEESWNDGEHRALAESDRPPR